MKQLFEKMDKLWENMFHNHYEEGEWFDEPFSYFDSIFFYEGMKNGIKPELLQAYIHSWTKEDAAHHTFEQFLNNINKN